MRKGMRWPSCEARGCRHLYDFLDRVTTVEQDFIVRGTHGRNFTVDGIDLFQAIAFEAVVASLSIELKWRPERAPRSATLHLRTGRLTLRRRARSKAWHETLSHNHLKGKKRFISCC